VREAFDRTDRNWPFFFEHVVRPWTPYAPDLAALRAASGRPGIVAVRRRAILTQRGTRDTVPDGYRT
jgi:hypothetical protein